MFTALMLLVSSLAQDSPVSPGPRLALEALDGTVRHRPLEGLTLDGALAQGTIFLRYEGVETLLLHHRDRS